MTKSQPTDNGREFLLLQGSKSDLEKMKSIHDCDNKIEWMLEYLRDHKDYSFTASEIHEATGVPYNQVRPLLTVIYSIQTQRQGRTYLFSAGTAYSKGERILPPRFSERNTTRGRRPRRGRSSESTSSMTHYGKRERAIDLG